MKRFSDYARGRVRLRVTGSRPERLLNLMAGQGLGFSKAERVDALTLQLTVARRDLKRVRRLAGRAWCETTVLDERGAPRLLRRLLHRQVLLVLPLLCVFAALFLSLFLWEIRVTGNEELTDAQILSALDEEGIRVGSFGLGIDRELLRSRMIARLPKLLWITVNVSGCRAEVIVRERREAPEILDPKQGTDVVAGKTGLVTRLEVFEGRPFIEKGQTVLQGETLISGHMESLSGKRRTVHAQGVVLARTWYSLSAEIPLSCTVKHYTGQVERKKALMIGNYRINFYRNGSIALDFCDKISYEESYVLPGGFLLPFRLLTAEYREYQAEPGAMELERARALLRQRLLVRLGECSAGEPLSLRFEETEESGFLRLTLWAECLEDIAQSVPIPPEATTNDNGVTVSE